uniref:DASH complex subunit DAD3 n=1 Tax=Candidozyma auris TaxID=498019 RepID=A0A0L0P1L5_CANAR
MKESLSLDYSTFSDLLLIEKELLGEYQLLALKLHALAGEIATLNKQKAVLEAATAAVPADALLGNMRNLERKIGLVYTLFKTAVYSMQLQNQELEEMAERGEREQQPEELHSEVDE